MKDDWKLTLLSWLKLIASKRVVVVALATAMVFGVGSASAEFEPVTIPDPTSSPEPSPSPSPSPSEPGVTPEGGGGGNINNEVVVINTVDGRSAHRSGFGVARVTGHESHNQNAAAATSSCNDCRTVAVAAQAVIIQRTDASVIKPTNLAIAINAACMNCETAALAYQLVFTTDGLVRLDDGVQQKLAGFRGDIAEVAGNEDISFPEMRARIDAIVDRMWATVESELEAVGVQGASRAAKDFDEATEDTGASPSPSPSPSESPSPEPSSSATPEPTPSDTDSSPTPEPSESPSPAPSESPSPSPT